MRTFGSKLGSHRMSVFETLADNPEGLTPPEIVSMSDVPKSTVHRILKDWREAAILLPAGRHGKSTIYKLNPRDEEVLLMVETVSEYTIRLASAQAAKREAEAWLDPVIATEDERLRRRGAYGMNALISRAVEPDIEGMPADDIMAGKPRIVIVGCGGAGNNTINRLDAIGVRGAETVAINTDKQHLDMIEADKKLLIGKSVTRGLGAGGYPEVAERCAEMAEDDLEEILRGADLVFITAGMGGGTGTGSAPVVAKTAKAHGAVVIGMVSTPFSIERARIVKASEGLEELRREADTVVALDYNRLLEKGPPNLPIDQAFSVMDQLISETVKGISETITQPSLINIDYADVKTIMGCGGVAVMLYGEAESQEPTNVTQEALDHSLLDVDYRGATGALVHMTGGPELTLHAAENIAQGLTMELNQQANVIWGARIDPAYEGRVRVMAIMTGVESANILDRDRVRGPAGRRAADARTVRSGDIP